MEEEDDFTYLSCKMSANRDGEMEVRARLSKASQTFASLRSTWRARNISQKTEIKIFKSNVIYGSELWKMTKGISHKLEVFQNRCLQRILCITWPDTISNENLHLRVRAGTEPITKQVKRRC